MKSNLLKDGFSQMSKWYLGIDLGTSSVRAYLTDFPTTQSFAAGEEYGVLISQVGFAEQSPEMWYQKTVLAIRKVLFQSQISAKDIKALSFSGQMHGLVALDEAYEPVGNAIIWLDQRSGELVERLHKSIGSDTIAQLVQNRLSAGMLASSLYWVKEKQPEIYLKIKHVLLPKDYIKFRLCGKAVTDFSDAAGSLVFDNTTLTWSQPLLDLLGIDRALFPDCLASTAVVGEIHAQAAQETGLVKGTPVVNGGADQCMQAIGNGIIDEGVFACNIGTAGQISTTITKPLYDKALRTNTFVHAIPERWNLMGACLNSGLSLNWFTKQVLNKNDYHAVDLDVMHVPAGSQGLFFLPYLTGERTPHMNPKARGVFFGLTLDHDEHTMERAVMEGVVFALKDCLNVLIEMGITCQKIVAAGGGAQSDQWLQMQADIFGLPVYRSASQEQACLGAAITAAVGTGLFDDYSQACNQCLLPAEVRFEPQAEQMKIYQSAYPIFQEIYRSNIHVFDRISETFRT